MTEDNKALLMILRTLKGELLNLAASSKTNVLKVSDLMSVFIFKILNDKEKNIVNQLIGEVVGDKAKLNTGQESQAPSDITVLPQIAAQAHENADDGGRSYSQHQFKSDNDQWAA